MPRKPVDCGHGCHGGEPIIVKNSNSDAKLLILKEQMQEKLEEELVSKVAIGNVKVGTTYPEGTSLGDILRDILGGSTPGPVPPTPTENVKVYYGLVNALPTTDAVIEALTLDESKDKDTLLESGYTWKKAQPDNQFFILAIPKDAGISCYQIVTNGYAAACEEAETPSYLVYHVGILSTGTYRVEYAFEE